MYSCCITSFHSGEERTCLTEVDLAVVRSKVGCNWGCTIPDFDLVCMGCVFWGWGGGVDSEELNWLDSILVETRDAVCSVGTN